MMRMLFFFIIINGLIACSTPKDSPPVTPPPIDVVTFKNMLKDLHIVEAQINQSSKKIVRDTAQADTLYTLFFEKYNTKVSDFIQSMDYYKKQPELFDKIYNDIINDYNSKLN